MPNIPVPILSLALVDLNSSLILAISDLSTYMSVLNSNNVSMQITPPGWPIVNVPFNPGNVNIYKCVDLGIECGDEECCELPDGIYSVLYTVQPTPWSAANPLPFIDKKFIKVDQIRCRWNEAFVKVDLECECYDAARERHLKELRKAKLYIDGAVAESNKGNYKLSYKYYTKAEQMLNALECKPYYSKTDGCNCG